MERIFCGKLFPAKWDENGHVISLVLDTSDQDEYFIARTGKGEELLPLINHRVELTGAIKEDNDHFVIHVKSYRPLDDDTGTRSEP